MVFVEKLDDSSVPDQSPAKFGSPEPGGGGGVGGGEGAGGGAGAGIGDGDGVGEGDGDPPPQLRVRNAPRSSVSLPSRIILITAAKDIVNTTVRIEKTT
jgi:hypothetical protein